VIWVGFASHGVTEEQIVLKTFNDVVEAGQLAFRATIKRPFTVDDFIADRRAEAARD
jgi:hypothetical protein